jgi:predicted nucleotide-binding protein (sugar kinase/HSP70/actin superfamily)
VTRPRNDRLKKGDTVLVPYLDRLISRFYADSFVRAGFGAVLLDADEKALSTGYRYASGGECMPLVSLMGGAIEKTRSLGLDPARTFFFLPTSCYACNFPQFPILSDLAFRSAGLDGLKVGLLNSMSLGERLSQGLAAKIFESGILSGVIHKVYNRVKPYEAEKGETDAALERAERSVSEAIRSGKDLRGALSSAIDEFRRIERDERRGRKARIELLGDLYVKYSGAVNRNLQAFVEELGGELVVPSITEYALHYYYADIRHRGDDPRHYNLLRAIEKRHERIAADLIGDRLEPDLAECARLMENERFAHYITGETSINVGRALHAIRQGADAIVHANPIFCCPGVVTASIYRRVQEESGIPIVDLFYDGTGNPNRLLIPHLHYLNRKKARKDLRS